MLIRSDFTVLGTRYYHEFGVPSCSALQHRAHNSFPNGSSFKGLRFKQQRVRSSGFGKGSVAGRWEESNMLRLFGRHKTWILHQFLLVGLQPALSAQSAHGLRSSGFSRNFALQTMDSSARSLIGKSASVLRTRPGGQFAINGGSSVRISCSNVPRVRPAIAHRSLRETRKLVTRSSRQPRRISSRKGSTGDFSPQWLLESAVDVLRNFNEKVNNLFQQGGEGVDSGSRDFATAAEKKVGTRDENAIREENMAPELVDTVSKQTSEFEWGSAIWEAEVSSAEELEAVTQRGGTTYLGGTDGDISQLVRGSNVSASALGEAVKIDETTPKAVSSSPELRSRENGNFSGAGPSKVAQSSLELEDRDISFLKQESKADSISGILSGSGHDRRTSSELTVSDVGESSTLGIAADVEIRAAEKMEEAAITEQATFDNRDIIHPEDVSVGITAQQEVSLAEIEEIKAQPVLFQTEVISSVTDGDISLCGESNVLESAFSEADVEIRADERIEEAIREPTTVDRQLEHPETGTMGSTIQVSESASFVEIQTEGEREGLDEADVKICVDEKFEESRGEVLTVFRDLEHPGSVEAGSAFRGQDGPHVEVEKVDIGELWNRNGLEYLSLAGSEPSLSTEFGPRCSPENTESLASDLDRDVQVLFEYRLGQDVLSEPSPRLDLRARGTIAKVEAETVELSVREVEKDVKTGTGEVKFRRKELAEPNAVSEPQFENSVGIGRTAAKQISDSETQDRVNGNSYFGEELVQQLDSEPSPNLEPEIVIPSKSVDYMVESSDGLSFDEDAHKQLSLDSTVGGETLSLERQVVLEEIDSLDGKSDEIKNASKNEEFKELGTLASHSLYHDSLTHVSVESGEAVESSSFGSETTLAGEAGAMQEVSLESQVVAEGLDSLVAKSDEMKNASEDGEVERLQIPRSLDHDSLTYLPVESGDVVESFSFGSETTLAGEAGPTQEVSLESQVVAEGLDSLIGKSHETRNESDDAEVTRLGIRRSLDHDSLTHLPVESGEAVESSSFGSETTLAREEGAMEEVKKITEDFGEQFSEEHDTANAAVGSDAFFIDRSAEGLDDLPLQHEIIRLRDSIRHYAYLYHTLDCPVISDGAYDSLVKKLDNLEAQVVKSETSLSVSVAAPPSPDMLKVVHSVPMLSLDSVQNEEEVVLWYQKLQQKLRFDQKIIEWVVEPKVDGLALSLRYEHGYLKRAATRGNGIQGEDVTHNAQRVLGIPLAIPLKLPGTESPLTVLEVRGEIFMSLEDFKELNASKVQSGEKALANPRNAAAGSMRLLPNANERRPLSFVGYSIAIIEGPALEGSEKSSLLPAKHWEVLQLLKSAGFAVNENNRSFDSFDSALEYAKSWRRIRKNLEYEADGVVMKINDLGTQALLGSTAAAPRWALAWKFAATEAVSVLEGIEITIGRSGAVIPNARLKPVKLGGTVISRASLHNFGHVKALGLCEGDHVVVQRAGDVIPQVVQVLEDLRPETATQWVPPQQCPTCGSTLTEPSASTMVFCVNPTCPSRHSRQIGHFAKTLIGRVGSTTLSLLEDDLVKDPADFYDLDEKSFSKVKGFGNQSIKGLLQAIEESKKQEVWLFLAALGIPKVGRSTAKELAKKFGTLEAVMESDVTSFMDVPGIGEATASCIFNWCQAEPNIELVRRLKEAGCEINGDQVTGTDGKPENDKDGSINGTFPDFTDKPEGEPDVVENLKDGAKPPLSATESMKDLGESFDIDESGIAPDDMKKNDETVQDVTSKPAKPLSGKSIVITGDFGTLKREDMRQLVTLQGGTVRTTVTSKTSFLLCGYRPGPLKVAEASRRGVKVVNWQEFLSLTEKA